jgi:hypothetical protein
MITSKPSSASNHSKTWRVSGSSSTARMTVAKNRNFSYVASILKGGRRHYFERRPFEKRPAVRFSAKLVLSGFGGFIRRGQRV